MLKKHMAACLVASAFMTMPVLAQTSTSPGATSPGANQPATSASSGAGSSAASQSASASGNFITNQQQNQWRASRLIGLTVYGSNNERIGDINEVLVDRQGTADAVVVGVGGFLGIGEKNVALPFNAFEWQTEPRRTASSGGSGSGTGAAGGTGGSAGADRTAATSAGSGSAAGTAPAATGSTSAAGGTAAGTGSASTGGSSAERGYPDHAVLRMTKADLENAPAFRYVGDRASDDRSGNNANRSTGAGGGMGAGSAGSGATGTGAGSAGSTSR